LALPDALPFGVAPTPRRYLGGRAAADARADLSRDLHDGLGHSLVSIILRAELTRQLIPDASSAARHELRELHSTAEKALAEMRSIARNAKRASFEHELASATGLLEAVGTRCDVRITDAPDNRSEQTLSWVLREAVTNIVRHSEATVCTIAAGLENGCFRLRISNDRALRSEISPGGQGLEDLASRMQDCGGSLAYGLEDDRFALEAVLPPMPEYALNDLRAAALEGASS
ncbi:histidine kinase, partial [Amycolatopsis sp. NPDC000740]|uniref:sensor histidine kinase n=1 Tax=Amycolatopsis sp. NPDC000740 TaxID=3154269 RepID=UPI0033318586